MSYLGNYVNKLITKIKKCDQANNGYSAQQLYNAFKRTWIGTGKPWTVGDSAYSAKFAFDNYR